MSASQLAELMDRSGDLTPEEQLRLASLLIERARVKGPHRRDIRHWVEIRGIARDLMLGMDAQEWVSRSRRDSDDLRSLEEGGTE